MNFKGNVFSTGKGRIADAVQKDGKIRIFQKNGSAYSLREFDPAKKAFGTVQQAYSYADLCWFFGEGTLQLFGSRLEVKGSL